MSVAAQMRKARALIEDEERWIKGHDARDADGRECDPESVKASCYCLGGALMAVGIEDLGAVKSLLGIDRSFVHHWNDAPERTHAEVLAALDRAIAAEESA